MKILTLPVGQMQSNCYLLIDEKTRETLIVDPGDDGEYIIQKLRDEDALPKVVVATHGHFDHVMAATEITLAYNIPFLMHKNDLPILHRHQSTAKYFLGISVDPPPGISSYLKHDDIVRIGKEKLRIIETPGHTPGSVCLIWVSKEKPTPSLLLSGDTLFAQGGVGRTDLSGGNKETLYHSIKTKLFSLPDNTIVYPGHGEPTTIGQEKKMHALTGV